MWTIKPYTKDRIPDVLAFEQQLRQEEDVWGWDIDDAYILAIYEMVDRLIAQHVEVDAGALYYG